jgi:hypothetical protein
VLQRCAEEERLIQLLEKDALGETSDAHDLQPPTQAHLEVPHAVSQPDVLQQVVVVVLLLQVVVVVVVVQQVVVVVVVLFLLLLQ